jgi:PAS domain S-box-containing protein
MRQLSTTLDGKKEEILTRWAKVKFFSRKARGWIDVGGTRMCLLDIPGGWLNLGTSIILFAGEDTYRRVMFEAGLSETFSKEALKKGILGKTSNGFVDAVTTYSEAGFGDFVINELRFAQGYAHVTCRNSFEGWAFLYNKRFFESPVCYYSTGVLLSFMQNISNRNDLVSAETKCIARGDDKCEFVIGTRVELRQRGIHLPEWGMTIRERAEYLENLLEEKRKVEGEITRKNAELSVLNKISATVNQSLNLAEIMNLAIRELTKIVGNKGIGIFLFDHKKEELIFTAQRGFSKEFYKSVSRLKIGEGMTGNVAEQKLPMAYDDYAEYPHALEPAVKKEKIKSLMSVPLMAKDKMVGVLNIASKTPYHFTSEEINLMTLIGNQIGVAIENAQLHEKIKESERKYKTLVEDINDGYLVCQNGKIVFTNQAFLAMHGYSREEVLGKELQGFFPSQCLQDVNRIFKNKMEGRNIPDPIEFLRMHKDGTRLPTELKINFVEFDGSPVMIGILSDISERKKMEQKIFENERLASVGQLAATIAHEIRNPLSSIKMNIQILSKHLKLQGFNKRRLEIAADEIKRLNQIVEDVLDFTKPIQMKKEPYRIEKIIEKGVQLLSDKMREKKVQIIQKISRPLPKVSIDWEQMEQAILNILLNAIEAMPIGGILEIDTGKAERIGHKMIKVEIKDTGIGIAPEHLARIFDPFFTTKAKGVGLGLSNVKKIIEAHDGIIEVDSRTHHGTSFRIFLPRSNEQ